MSIKKNSPRMTLGRLPSWHQKYARNLTPEFVTKYLNTNPKVLEDFLVTSATSNVLEKILAKKKRRGNLNAEVSRSPPLVPATAPAGGGPPKRIVTPTGLYTDSGMKHMCKQIVSCTEDVQIYDKIYEMCQVMAKSTQANDFIFFVLKNSGEDLALYSPETGAVPIGPVATNASVATHVAKMKMPVNIQNVHMDDYFTNGTGVDKFRECHVLALPVILDCGTLYCIIEFVKTDLQRPFETRDIQLTNGIFCWVTACVQKMKMNKMLSIQENLNKFLLESTKVMFDDMVDTDRVINIIMAFTKQLVSADRCTVFLVDEEREELYADHFDEGLMSEDNVPIFRKKSQIRFPKDKGIAGYVAETGETVNIKDAYGDERFNTEIDQKTGYHTKNILCMPIQGKTGVIAVVQMINRLNGPHFTLQDMTSFKMFAVYCALALHYSRLYSKLFQSQMKCRIAMDMMHYHITCSDDEFQELVANPLIPDEKIPNHFFDFNFCCYDYEPILPELFIKMMTVTFGETFFDLSKMCKFILTVRKNYRPIQYHNWQHGFHVAHAVWRMLECAGFECSKLEKIAFIVGGVLHDVDHRGYNNEFFKKLQHPLAALYPTSVMEQHHFKQAVTILHEEGRDILSGLTPSEHKQVIGLIRQYIMATDLASFFPNNKFLNNLIEKNEFDVTIPAHRDGLSSLIMTSSDLCAITKPWKTQQRTAEMIYNEFYMQGDEERKRGLQPIPMMDRANKGDIPKMQVGFISFVCKPMYETLNILLPKTRSLLDGCMRCKEHWEAVVTKHDRHPAATT